MQGVYWQQYSSITFSTKGWYINVIGHKCPEMLSLWFDYCQSLNTSTLKVNFFNKKAITFACLNFETRILVSFCVINILKLIYSSRN